MSFHPLIVGILILLLAGCSLQKSAGVRYQEKFDFGSVRAYSFLPRDSVANEEQNISDVMRNNIELALEQVLDDSGLHYTEARHSDLVVAYHLIQGQSHGPYQIGVNHQALKRYNLGVKYCEYCLKSGSDPGSRKLRRLDVGTLILDLLDPDNQRSVWRSIYPVKIKAEDNSRKVQEKIQTAIALMLAQYPGKSA
ncbi:DUF4136 domain-containing protein [Thalassomonas actiniarum]|uniref:DUF4136 domain-containing protein n=1 Tax=Thalassomonas actiniarum TaxID=485447 RepID=A0AAE9YSV4_9GAMM|nr:DUF4136 domain-containing protein [Thalassomonas actiniarum]WDD99659.1 DUF4136 domain-containing protein [Thalassomonas actiniarum]